MSTPKLATEARPITGSVKVQLIPVRASLIANVITGAVLFMLAVAMLITGLVLS